MIGLGLAFWSPHLYLRHGGGLAGFLVWAFAIDFKADRTAGFYMAKIRLFGIEPGIYANFARENGKKRVYDDANIDDWAEQLNHQGIRFAIPDHERLVDKAGRNFMLPTDMGEMTVEIGDRIAVGTPSSYFVVKVTGSRPENDSTTRFFYTVEA